MGVTGENKEAFEFQYVEKELDVIENYLDDNDVPPQGQATPRSRRRRFVPLSHVREATHRRRLGARQARRIDNLHYLIEMSEQEEIDPADLEYVELVEPGLSAFAELFVESEKMKIWNDFINCSEDEQKEILMGMSQHLEDSGEEDGDLDRQESWEMMDAEADDKRDVHPAFSAKQCYQRIDQNLRAFLRKKQVPWGALEHLEEEVTEFFLTWPASVFVSKLESSFERMLLHALCQYLDLHSFSYNDADGTRQTQVENNRNYFAPPKTPLSQYLTSSPEEL